MPARDTATSSPTFVFTDRADVLGYVPYSFGFHPADSVVLIGLQEKRIAVGARADTDWPIAEIIRQFGMVLHRSGGISAVLLIGYGPAPDAAAVTAEVSDALTDLGYDVRETLLVNDGRYHCMRCDDCTEPGGTPYDLTTSAGAALGTYEGLVVRPDRACIERLVDPIGGLAQLAMAQAVDRTGERLAALLDAAPRTGRDGHRAVHRAGEQAVDEALRLAEQREKLDDDQAAWLSVLLADLHTRDHAWLHTDGEDWQLEFWLDLTQRCDEMLVAPVATLLGWCAWRSGNGVIAGAALDRALRADPGYNLARMLINALSQGLPPSTIDTWPVEPRTRRTRRRKS